MCNYFSRAKNPISFCNFHLGRYTSNKKKNEIQTKKKNGKKTISSGVVAYSIETNFVNTYFDIIFYKFLYSN